jgi:hypothetical protein
MHYVHLAVLSLQTDLAYSNVVAAFLLTVAQDNPYDWSMDSAEYH